MLTTDQFWQEATAIGERYLGAPSLEETRRRFAADIEQLVDRLYFDGGMLADRIGPIHSRAEVHMIVDIGPHKMTCVATRQANFSQER